MLRYRRVKLPCCCRVALLLSSPIIATATMNVLHIVVRPFCRFSDSVHAHLPALPPAVCRGLLSSSPNIATSPVLHVVELPAVPPHVPSVAGVAIEVAYHTGMALVWSRSSSIIAQRLSLLSTRPPLPALVMVAVESELSRTLPPNAVVESSSRLSSGLSSVAVPVAYRSTVGLLLSSPVIATCHFPSNCRVFELPRITSRPPNALPCRCRPFSLQPNPFIHTAAHRPAHLLPSLGVVVAVKNERTKERKTRI